MHPSILKPTVTNLYTLGSVELPDLTMNPNAIRTDLDYRSQLVLFGPDAAVEVKEGLISLFMDGAPTDNAEFAAFVEADRDQVLTAATGKTKSAGETVIFTGKWHHVDYDMLPFFRPYVIHVINATGTTTTLASVEDIFCMDRDNTYFSGDYIDSDDLVENPHQHFRDASEQSIRYSVSSPFSSGFFSFGGILWHPSDSKGAPLYVPLDGTVTHRIKHVRRRNDLNVSIVAPFRAVDPAFSKFKSALRTASVGTPSSALASAHGVLALTIQALPYEEDRQQVWDFVGSLLGRWRFDETAYCLVPKVAEPEGDVITLEQTFQQTTATGYWSIIRFAESLEEQAPEFETFLSSNYHSFKDVALTRCAPQSIDGDEGGCIFASDWIPYAYGVHRVLAFGPEARLAW